MIIYSPVSGDCMGAEWENVLAVIDSDAPIHSGDVVQLGIRHGDVVSWILKRLRTHAGLWYAQCDDGCFPLHPTAVVPDVVRRVIGREPLDGAPPAVRSPPKPSDRELEYYRERTREARAAWDAGSEQLGVPWPGLDAVVGVRPPSHQIARAAA